MRQFLMHRFLTAAAAASMLSIGWCGQAFADAATTLASGSSSTVAADSGQGVYQHVCQGCHMPGGRGAVGAAAFPKLAGNTKLASSGYPVYVVLNGLGGMPWFNGTLSDAQVAGVVNYIRTNFGNHYADPVSVADVAAVRGPVPTVER